MEPKLPLLPRWKPEAKEWLSRSLRPRVLVSRVPHSCIFFWPPTAPPAMVSHAWPCHHVKSWCLSPRVLWEFTETWAGRTGGLWHGDSHSGQRAQWQWWALQTVSSSGFKLPPLLTPRHPHPPRLMKCFPRVCQGRSYLPQKFTSHPAYFLLRLVRVMGKGFVEWGKLMFLFCFEWFCSESLLFPTSCW